MGDSLKKDRSTLRDAFRPSSCLTLDQFIAYAEGRCSAGKRHGIEKHLVDCEFCSDAMKGLALSGEPQDVRRRVKELNDEIRAYGRSKPDRKRGWILSYSAAAVLLLAVASMLVVRNRKPPNEVLFGEFFKPYPNAIPLVRGEEPAGPMESAMVEYENENYGESLRILRDLLAMEPENGPAHFYAGISCLCLNDPRTAVDHLRQAARGGENGLSDPAAWYTALARLKNGEMRSAKALLDSLRVQNGPFTAECLELSNRLQKYTL